MSRLPLVRHKSAPKIRPVDMTPPSQAQGHLTVFVSAIMSFLASFAIMMALLSGHIAHRWENVLSGTATIRLPASVLQSGDKTQLVLDILTTTPGVTHAYVIPPEEQADLLAPWFGESGALNNLPLPQLIAINEDPAHPYDRQSLKLRLKGEVPQAIFDDHRQWQIPLVKGAQGFRLLAVGSLFLIGTGLAGMMVLAINAALSSNRQNIEVLHLVGAQDAYIIRAFMSRFVSLSFLGSLAGTTLAGILLWGMPSVNIMALIAAPDSPLERPFLQGDFMLLWLLSLPPICAVIAWLTTYLTTTRLLRKLT